MDNNVYPLFVLFQNKIFVNIYMNKIYVYKNRLYQIEFKKFQFDTAPFGIKLSIYTLIIKVIIDYKKIINIVHIYDMILNYYCNLRC